MEQSPGEANSHSVKKWSAFHGTERCITVFTTACSKMQIQDMASTCRVAENIVDKYSQDYW